MYRIFYAEKDTTLYERFPEQNAGIDQILELTKNVSGSLINGKIRGETFNSRILIDFGSEINTLRSAVVSGKIPPIGNSENSASVFLTLRSSDATDLLQEYTLDAFPVSQSWINGQGYAHDLPKSTKGASWYYRNSKDQETYWNTGSIGNTYNWFPGVQNKIGGGVWIAGSTYNSSQSFNNQIPDIRMDVTDIVNHWVSGDIPNYGFIVKRTNLDEKSGDSMGSIKFFGRESHTIFVPKLEVAWDDYTASGNASVISDELIIPYFKNIKSEYRASEIARFRIGVRGEFPTRTYSTASFYLGNDVLPVSSSYAIFDYETNEPIIPFTDNWGTSYTKISSDVNGNYFDLRMDAFLPERYYKMILKCERSNDIRMFDEFYFKVVS